MATEQRCDNRRTNLFLISCGISFCLLWAVVDLLILGPRHLADPPGSKIILSLVSQGRLAPERRRSGAAAWGRNGQKSCSAPAGWAQMRRTPKRGTQSDNPPFDYRPKHETLLIPNTVSGDTQPSESPAFQEADARFPFFIPKG